MVQICILLSEHVVVVLVLAGGVAEELLGVGQPIAQLLVDVIEVLSLLLQYLLILLSQLSNLPLALLTLRLQLSL